MAAYKGHILLTYQLFKEAFEIFGPQILIVINHTTRRPETFQINQTTSKDTIGTRMTMFART